MKNRTEIKQELVNECYDRSIRLLKKNSTLRGIIACASSEKAVGRNYASVFGRDAAICSLGMVESGDPVLIERAMRSLVTLAEYQAPNGQIPKYVKPDTDETDFWYYGCIDATLWWLIAISCFDRHVPGQSLMKTLATEIQLALNWLSCQEHQSLFLIQQNEASDWADIMPRTGFVLYSNSLWYKVKKLYNAAHAKETKHYFNLIFSPFNNAIPENRRARILVHYIKNMAKKSDFYLSFVNFSYWGEDIDVFGNILSALLGLASPSQASRMVDSMMQLNVNRPYPVRVVSSPVEKDSPLWRTYMGRYQQNFPYKYHNGGIWPFVGAFWVILLSQLGRKKLASEELYRLAESNRINNWEFNEWFHGKTGKPMGMAGQSWNAAMFILAYRSLMKKISF